VKARTKGVAIGAFSSEGGTKQVCVTVLILCYLYRVITDLTLGLFESSEYYKAVYMYIIVK